MCDFLFSRLFFIKLMLYIINKEKNVHLQMFPLKVFRLSKDLFNLIFLLFSFLTLFISLKRFLSGVVCTLLPHLIEFSPISVFFLISFCESLVKNSSLAKFSCDLNTTSNRGVWWVSFFSTHWCTNCDVPHTGP